MSKNPDPIAVLAAVIDGIDKRRQLIESNALPAHLDAENADPLVTASLLQAVVIVLDAVHGVIAKLDDEAS